MCPPIGSTELFTGLVLSLLGVVDNPQQTEAGPVVFKVMYLLQLLSTNIINTLTILVDFIVSERSANIFRCF